MEVWMVRGAHNFFLDDGHQLAVMKGSCFKLLLPWTQRPFVEWDLDLDWGFVYFTVSPPQVSVDSWWTASRLHVVYMESH